MADTPEDELKPPIDAFNATLASHGYALPQAILLAASAARSEDTEGFGSTWEFEPTEFPVSVQGYDSRVDFILRNRSLAAFLVAECKRSNPAFNDWCFCRFRFVRPGHKDRYYAEKVSSDDTGRHLGSSVAELRDLREDEAFHMGFEVKGKAKGDSGGDPHLIEKAMTQACRGLNGLVEHFAREPQTLSPLRAAVILPVVFTTATLWTSDFELHAADLATGEPPPVSTLRHVPWLFY